MSIAGGSGGARSAAGSTGFGFCTLGTAGWVRTLGCGADASGSVCAAAGTAAGSFGPGAGGVLALTAAGVGDGGGVAAARPSSTSSFFDCCSTARSASQLASAATSMVRLGVSTGPFNAMATSGRGVRRSTRAARPEQGEPRIERAFGEIDASAHGEIGTLRAHRRIAQPRLTGIDGDRTLGTRDGEDTSRERGIHPVPHSGRVDRQALIDRTDHGVEGRRIETHHTPIFEREGAAAFERTDERNRAHAGPFRGDVEGQPAGDQSVAGEEFGGIGVGEPHAAARREPLRAAQEGQLPAQAAAGNAALDRLQCDLRFAELEHAPHVARGELRRERDARRLDRDLAFEADHPLVERL